MFVYLFSELTNRAELFIYSLLLMTAIPVVKFSTQVNSQTEFTVLNLDYWQLLVFQRVLPWRI